MCAPAHRQRIWARIKADHRREPISAIILQETLMKSHIVSIAKKEAYQAGFELIATPSKPDVAKGGCVAILIPRDAIELKQGETYHDAITRIRAGAKTMKGYKHNSLKLSHTIAGQNYTIVGAYAPQEAQQRIHFMTQLKGFIDTRTVLGIDANCVPDPAIDIKRSATSAYDNRGQLELAEAVSNAGLVDVARAHHGDAPFFTAFHNRRYKNPIIGLFEVAVTKTRIDQLYAPDTDSAVWSHEPQHDIFDRKADAAELDHEPLQIVLQRQVAKHGNDLKSINEDIYDDPKFTKQLHTAIVDIIEDVRPDETNLWFKTWQDIKQTTRTMSLKETSRRKYQENVAVKLLQRKRDTLKK